MPNPTPAERIERLEQRLADLRSSTKGILAQNARLRAALMEIAKAGKAVTPSAMYRAEEIAQKALEG